MRGFLSFCFTFLLCAAPSIAATFDRDDRVAITRPDPRFLPIGVIKGGKSVSHATGFLVSACHVLTVKHAAGRVATVAGRRMTFRLPFAGSEGTSAGTVVAAGALDLVADANRLERSEDWLLLRLDRCLGERFGFLELNADNEPASLRTSGLQSAGFPDDRSWRQQLTLDPDCQWRVAGDLPVHDCSSLPGNSGSPIFTTTERGGQRRLAVVAMHSTATVIRKVVPFRGEDGSVATRIADVLPAIRAYLADPRPVLASLSVARPSRAPASR